MDTIRIRARDCELRSCPSRLLIKELKKVLSSFAECLDKVDVVSAAQSTHSDAEAFLDKRDGTFETRLKNKKRVKDVPK